MSPSGCWEETRRGRRVVVRRRMVGLCIVEGVIRVFADVVKEDLRRWYEGAKN
jgi:hypothetical protein